MHCHDCVVNQKELVGDEFAARAEKFLLAKRALEQAQKAEKAAKESLLELLPPGPGTMEGAGVIVTRYD